jgi:hypothetical protein
MAIALLVGATWIHIDYLVIIVAFFLIGLVPLLGLVFMLFLVVLIGGLINKQAQSTREGMTGMALVFIFVFSSFFSTWAVDRFNKYRGAALIEQLEQYRQRKGCYPATVAALDHVNKPLLPAYYYYGDTGHYAIRFKNGWMITTVFDSRSRQWVNYGWND